MRKPAPYRRGTMGSERELAVSVFRETTVQGKKVFVTDNDLFERAVKKLSYGGTRNRRWLKNGGCVYQDFGLHPEVDGPECLTGSDVALHDRVGLDSIIQIARQLEASWSTDRQVKVLLFSNNTSTDHHSFGYHANFMVPFPTESDKEKYKLLAPFFAAGQLIWGAGLLVPVDSKCWAYRISQRSHFISRVESIGTTSIAQRGMYGFKNEGDVPFGKFSRVQVICTDSNILDSVTELKFELISIMLEVALCHPKFERLAPRILDPIRFMKSLSANFGRDRHQAASILRCYIDLAYELAEITGRSEWKQWLAKADHILAMSVDGMEALVGLTDYATKWCFISPKLEKGNLGGALKRNLLYHEINGHGYVDEARALDPGAVSKRSIDHGAVRPPRDTRAYVRGSYVRSALDMGVKRGVWGASWHNLSAEQCPIKVNTHDPYSTDTSVLEPLLTYLQSI